MDGCILNFLFGQHFLFGNNFSCNIGKSVFFVLVFLNCATFVEKRHSWVEQQSSVMWAVPMTNQIFSANAKQLLLPLFCVTYIGSDD